MTSFFSKLFKRYPIKTRRSLELLPGLLVWTLISFPIWGSFVIPVIVAYFILFFDIFFFYKSFSLAITAFIASKKIRDTEKQDWNAKAQQLPDAKRVHHILIIPNYKEKVDKIRCTLQALAGQSYPASHLHVVLAMEEREKDARERAKILINEYKHVFGSIFATYHKDIPNEVKGKSSNEAYAGREAYRLLFEKGNLDINYATVSSVDADSIFHKEFFALLTYKFLTDTRRYNKFWQSANVYHNNIWKVPAPTRIISFFGSLWRTALLVQGDRLITNATYSLSFKMLKEIDFWDTDVIPEDYRIFFKAFFRLKGNVWVEPIFLKTSMDAAQSLGYINSLKNKYHQERRWAWGVSDDALFIQWGLTVKGMPFWRKNFLIYHVLLDHILWPTNWFIVTVAANIIAILNPIYSRTSLGYYLPQMAGILLSSCLVALVIMLYIDYKNRPENANLPFRRKLLFPLEFILMPIVGFFLSALPALISHTQLMLGKRLEYKVTEKV
ncbi:glycosyltransferase family 2 protein [Patescibacteria group bacterium]|nr:glycosyltransferase family 2 protein [Patescibacteria group bacterium]MBU4098083.1 glycosyltransferase family 2 protein [Patescibacteria group bacterium]